MFLQNLITLCANCHRSVRQRRTQEDSVNSDGCFSGFVGRPSDSSGEELRVIGADWSAGGIVRRAGTAGMTSSDGAP